MDKKVLFEALNTELAKENINLEISTWKSSFLYSHKYYILRLM